MPGSRIQGSGVRLCRSWLADRRPSGRVGGCGASARPRRFTEVGPAPRGRRRKGPQLRRQQRVAGIQSAPGWSEGLGSLPSACSTGRDGVALPRAAPELRRAARRRPPRDGLRARRSRRPHPAVRGGLPVLPPRASGPARVAARPPVRRRLLLRPDVLDARGRAGRVDLPRRARDGLLRPARRSHGAADEAPAVAALDRLRLGRDRVDPRLLAVQRHALGPALLRHRRYAVGRGAAVARVHRREPAAGRHRDHAGLAGARRVATAARGRRWPSPRCSFRSLLRLSRRTRRTRAARSPSRSCRATCRARATTWWRCTARSPATMCRPPSTWRTASRRGRSRSPTSSSGPRTPRPSTLSSTRR